MSQREWGCLAQWIGTYLVGHICDLVEEATDA